MKQEKMTADEVQVLRENAERERNRHAWAMKLIRDVEKGIAPPLSRNYQLEIIERKRESEILALLEVYAENQDNRLVLVDDAQKFILDHGDELPNAKEYLLKNFPLCLMVEVGIFRADKPMFMKDGDEVKEFYPKFSQEGEEFIVKETLANCLKVDHITTELYFLTGYIKNHELSPLAQIALMDFLTPDTYSDRLTEELSNFVIDYIAKYKTLAFTAQLKLIRSGDHALIMYYITNSAEGIQTKEVLDALIKRGDREEITAYFNRYAHED